jgi:hypothetical protein
MSLDTLHISLRKGQAILCAATPEHLGELHGEEVRWLVHAASDYVEEALENLHAEMGFSATEEDVANAHQCTP